MSEGLEPNFDQTPKKTVTETKDNFSDWRKAYHKKDIADITQLVLNNPSLFQGQLTAETRFKKIVRAEGESSANWATLELKVTKS